MTVVRAPGRRLLRISSGSFLSHGAVLLVIKNFGPSSATDVRVTFDPAALAKEDVAALPNSDMKKWLYQRFAESVPIWAPG